MLCKLLDIKSIHSNNNKGKSLCKENGSEQEGHRTTGHVTWVVRRASTPERTNIAWLRPLDNAYAFNMGKIANIKVIVCSSCPKQFPSPAKKEKHEKACHENKEIFRCSNCPKVFVSKVYFVKHQKKHEVEKMVKCSRCDLLFPGDVEKTEHEMTKHSVESPCSFCSKTFVNAKFLRIHERKHTGEKLLQCRFCDKPCTTREKWEKHEARHQEKMESFRCGICSKEFVSEETKRKHERKRHAEKAVESFKCKFCEKEFTSEKRKITHEETHEPEGHYQCSMCLQGFGAYMLQMAHEEMGHKGEPTPYRCHFCTERFANDDARKDHEAKELGWEDPPVDTSNNAMEVDDKSQVTPDQGTSMVSAMVPTICGDPDDDNMEPPCKIPALEVTSDEVSFSPHLPRDRILYCGFCLKTFNSPIEMDTHLNTFNCDVDYISHEYFEIEI